MIWTILYWFLLMLAIVVGLRAWFWDRAGFRGRPEQRCKKCWYDLSGAHGDLAKEAIRCPECGKEHKSKRSMRKTRRSRRWIMVALLLWVGGYWASVTPKIQKRGWGAAVPRVVLVASLPFLSEKPGSGLGSIGAFGPAAVAVPISKYEKMVLKEVGESTFRGWGSFSADQEFGWLSRRLAFALARLESDATLTNGTHAKGKAYQSVLTQIVRADDAFKFERVWAQQVLYVEIETARAFGPEEDVYGAVKIRRLVQGGYEIQFGNMGTIYRCSTPNGMWTNGIHPINTPIEYWIERFLWDSVTEKNKARGRSYTERGY